MYQTVTSTNNPAGMPYAPIVNNPNMNWNGITGQYMAPSSGQSGVFGAYGGGTGGGGGGFPGGIQGLFNTQQQSNLDTQKYNRGLWGDLSGYAKGAVQSQQNDPLFVQARQNALNLARDPEAINDRVQQRMVNRGSNLANAASNAQRDDMRRQMAARGMLGGSGEKNTLGDIERNRQARLMGLGSDIEAQRAIRRNQDIMNASNMAAGFAGQQANFQGSMANSMLANAPYEGYTDYSGMGGLFAGQGGGGGFGLDALMMGGGRQHFGRNDRFMSGLSGMNQQGPVRSHYGTYADNFMPWTQGGFGAGQSLYTNGQQYGGMGPQYGNMFTGGRLDRGNANPNNFMQPGFGNTSPRGTPYNTGPLWNRTSGVSNYGNGTYAPAPQNGISYGNGITYYEE